MKRRLFKTLAAVLAIAAAAAGPVRGQDANVSWVLTPYGDLQTGDAPAVNPAVKESSTGRLFDYGYRCGVSDDKDCRQLALWIYGRFEIE